MNQEVKVINGYRIKDEVARNQTNENKNKIADINSVVKFHSVHKSSATYIAEFPNGKNLIIDTGLSTQWNDIKQAIDNLEITKFDYVVITHFHPDHIGNIQNLIDNYDVKNARWFIQMKPDFVNHSEDIDESENDYDNVISLLYSNEITPVVPENNSYLEIDDDIKLHFLNTNNEIAENYYNTYAEWRTTKKPNFNVFSLITEIIHKKVRILSTGDLERPTEEEYSKYLSKCNIMTIPHHGVNRDAYIPFYETTIPDYSIAQYIDGTIEDTPDSWVGNQYKSFMTLKDLNSKIITAKSTKSVNGLFTFISNGYTVFTNALDGGISDNVCRGHKIYSRLDELVNFSTQTMDTITLQEILNNLPLGSYYHGLIGDAMESRYPQLFSDLQNIFGNFLTSYSNLDMYTDYSVSNSYVIKLYNANYEIMATKISTGNWALCGNGKFNDVEGIDNLITFLKTLPKGHYTFSYKDDVGSVLTTGGYYNLSVDLTSNNGTNITASIIAILRNTSQSTGNIVVAGYFNTGSTPQYVWHVINN